MGCGTPGPAAPGPAAVPPLSTHAQGGEAYASFVEKWLAAEPEARLARVFVAAWREPREEALACFEHELFEAALAVRDAGLAQAKLGWWHEELERAFAGAARHPVARRLHECGGLGDGDGPAAQALVHGASRLAMLESPADFGALLMPFRAFAGTARRLRLRDAGADALPDETLGAALLANALRHWPRFAEADRARVPLDLLARVQATRRQLVEPGSVAAAAAVLEALAGELQTRLSTEATRGDAIPDARRICALHLVRAFRRNPAASVAAAPRVRGLPLMFALWRVARRTTKPLE